MYLIPMPGSRFSELCLRIRDERINNCEVPTIDFRIKLDTDVLNKPLLRKDYYSCKILKVERDIYIYRVFPNKCEKF